MDYNEKDLKIEFFNNPNQEKFAGGGTYVMDFKNVTFFIESGYLIIEEPDGDETKGYIFSLDTIKVYKYKTHVS